VYRNFLASRLQHGPASRFLFSDTSFRRESMNLERGHECHSLVIQHVKRPGFDMHEAEGFVEEPKSSRAWFLPRNDLVSVSHHRNADSISFFVLIIMGEVWVVSGSPPELDRSGRISAL
jgi:hypothetical protein